MKLNKMIREKWVRVIWTLIKDGTSILEEFFSLAVLFGRHGP